MKVFETYESESARKGQAGLYDSLMRIPNIVHQYYNRLAAELNSLLKDTPLAQSKAEVKPQPISQPPVLEFPGHGSTLKQFTPVQNKE